MARNKFPGIKSPAQLEKEARRDALKLLRITRGKKAKLVGRDYTKGYY